MKPNKKSLTIPDSILSIPALSRTERVLLSHLTKHPGCRNGQLAALTRRTPEKVQALINELCNLGHLQYGPRKNPRQLLVLAASPLSEAQVQELASAEVDLTQHGLTVQAAGDTLLSLLEQKLFRFRLTDYVGVACYRFKVSPLGLSLLLECGMRRRVQERRGGVAGQQHSAKAGVSVSRSSAASQPTATRSSKPTDELSAVERLSADCEGKARRVSTLPLGSSDARQVGLAKGWLDLGNWGEAQWELSQIQPLFRYHPTVLAVSIATYGAAKEWDYAWHLALIRTLLVPACVEGWLAAANAARYAPRAGLFWGITALILLERQHPNQPLISYSIARFCCLMGDLDGVRENLHNADGKDGWALAAMSSEDPDFQAYWKEFLKNEP